MKLDELAVEEFKDYIVESSNQDVYYQLKDWINDQIDNDQDYSEVMDFFINNLHGSLQWTHD